MVIPFSNTKLRVPQGFQSLLVGLSTEVLRSQPRNIHAFAAEYFEKLLQRRDQGHSTGLEKHSALEDRYYNNKSFQEEYAVNDPEVNQAATKIQAKFRGHKARREVETLKRDNKQTIDTDQQDLGYHRDDTSASPREHHDQHPSSRPASARHPSEPVSEQNDQHGDPNQYQEEELTEAEKEEQDRAARAIQARFRGHREKKSATEQIQSPPQSTRTSDESARGYHQDLETERTPTGNVSEREEFRHHPEDMFGGDTDDLDRPRFEREPTQLSEDFERHTQLPRDSDFGREVDEHHREGEVEHQEEDEDDMADPSLEKAATRIQATFRGYKTRKELGPHPHQSPTTAEHEHHQTEHEDEHATTHEPDDEETAAVKIQAAFRGYRTRKELDK